MLKATKDIYADKDNKIVPEPSTVSGTFKVAAAGGAISEQEAARYGINASNMSQYGLEAIQADPSNPGSGFGLDNSAMNNLSQSVAMGAGVSAATTRPATPPVPPTSSPAPGPTAKPSPAMTTKAAPAEKK